MTPRKFPYCVVNNILMFKLWSDYHVYVSTITKKYLLGKSVVTYRSFELLIRGDELLDRLVLHVGVR